MVVSVPTARPKRSGVLRFSRECDVVSGGVLELTNDGGLGESVSFKVKSTCANEVMVTPVKGVIPPGGTMKLSVYCSEAVPGAAKIQVVHSIAGSDECWKNVFIVKKEGKCPSIPPAAPCATPDGLFTIKLTLLSVNNKSAVPYPSLRLRARRLEVESASAVFPAEVGKSQAQIPPVVMGPNAAIPPGGRKTLLYLTLETEGGDAVGQQVKLDATSYTEQEKRGELAFGAGLFVEVSMRMQANDDTLHSIKTPPVPSSGRANPIESGLVKAPQRVNVCLRLKPLLGAEASGWVVNNEANIIRHTSEPNKLYVFDSIIPESASNAAVYDHINMKHTIERYTAGINATVFAYGQTSSGKTHTMYGGAKADGVIPRAVQLLFVTLKEMKDVSVELKATYFEIYNEDIFDLLDACKPVQLRETEAGAFTPVGLKEKVILSSSECLSLLTEGNENRSVGFSNLNDRSSRSHTVFRLSLTVKDKVKKTLRKSQLNLVDLAGSESLLETIDVTQKRETTRINLSLSYLKKVITELSRNTPHIVYRNSSLTKVLKTALGGNSLTTVICTATRAEDHRKETKSTLLFGMTAKTIKNKVKINEMGTRQHDQRLLQEIENLKRQLAVTEDELMETRAAVQVLTKEKEKEKLLDKERVSVEAEREPDDNSAPDDSVTDEAMDAIEKDLKMKDLIQDVLDYLYYGCPVFVSGTTETAMLYLTDVSLSLCTVDGNGVPNKKEVIDSIPLDHLDIALLGNHDSGRGITFVASELKQTIDIICKTSTDKEAWMLAITQATVCELHWAQPLDISKASGLDDLLPPEVDLCESTHIMPCDYLNAKGQILSTGFNFLTIYDIRTLTSLDLYRSTAVLTFFIKQGWLTRHELLKVNHKAIQ
eukprot:TRINITY_DN14800_c1_g1_i1.p1 TRINITY_DN14800_c1_g1~~TRINITY_DN14800_c1_g1_i1.p1  ORF type:complete len:881 (+),score=231.60 TRINITY_DN14800_c1_g1_i1:77-2719(+)